MLDLYEQAPALAQRSEAISCVDEKTSLQARQRVSEPPGSMPHYPMQVAARSHRMGAIHLCCALMVATGMTVVQCFPKRCCADVKTFLLALIASAAGQGLRMLQRILDHGSTPAPQQ